MADSAIQSNAVATLDLFGKGLWGPYYVNRQTALKVYVNNNDDVVSVNTVDGGLTWPISLISGGTMRGVACWFDQETPGDAGVLVNIIALDSGNNEAEYFSVNAETRFVGPNNDITIQGSLTVSTTPNLNRCCITKTRSGDLIAGYSTQSEISCERSDDNGATWSVIDDIYETATEEDMVLLFCADTGDPDDAAALFLDRSAGILSVKIYDRSIDTWVNETTVFTMTADDIYFNFDASIRHSDGHLLVNGHSAHDTTGDDFLSADVTLTLTPSVVAKTNVFTNQAESALCAVIIDQNNDDWYVTHAKGGTWEATVDIVFHKSDDGGATWEAEEAYSEDTADDKAALSGGRTIGENGGFIQWIWFDDASAQLFNNLVNDILIQAGSAPVGGVWRLNYGTASPTLFEDGASGFAGVSGLLTSATEADVQLKVYHQYIFKNLNVQASTKAGDSTYVFALADDGVQSTNLAITIDGTAFLEDVTGSALVAANSLVNYDIDGAAGMHGDDVAIRQAQISYENASILAPIFAGADFSTHSATTYILPGAFDSTTEATKQLKTKRSTIYKNLRLFTSIGSSIDWDCAPTKDGVASTNVAVNVTGVGQFEDVAGSESFSDGELFGIEYLRTSGSITVNVLQIEANTFEDWKLIQSAFINAARQYYGFNYVGAQSSANVDNLESRIGTVLAGNLQSYIVTAGDGTRDISLREGGSESTNVSINVLVTGFVEDISGFETILDTDGVGISQQRVGGSVSAAYAWAAVEIPHTVVVVAVTFPVIPTVLMQAVQRAAVY